ncbi:DUF2164 domain-containing protein [Alteromonas sp. ASW11-36]|uniref:DUF2164 domain-containing protein n=1 Tax=Alteromonas arenosi TaxID=3055817 RepID=A0ABT7T1C0_9ALTE|nr:DUF2164 domain-containing protein [Alteromonas sp. ASW11-36]MDM7861599.1 DUF2164 domain-containing protein [Alteromonas sp. ASW11-36]
MIELRSEDKAHIILQLQAYLSRELDVEIGQFDADFLLDFFAKEFGSIFYNQGLYDSQSVLQDKLETLNDAIAELEKPVTR